MTKKPSRANVSNSSNAANSRNRASSRERHFEKENGGAGGLRAAQTLDPSRNEQEVEDTSNALFVGPERPGVLTRSQVSAVQNLRRKGKSIDKIHDVTGLSKSTVFKYTKSITPTV